MRYLPDYYKFTRKNVDAEKGIREEQSKKTGKEGGREGRTD
jgi:hypothetical protein